jgi:hypothetical protein
MWNKPIEAQTNSVDENTDSENNKEDNEKKVETKKNERVSTQHVWIRQSAGRHKEGNRNGNMKQNPPPLPQNELSSPKAPTQKKISKNYGQKSIPQLTNYSSSNDESQGSYKRIGI